MVARGSRPRSPPCGTTCPSNAARCTRSATCWRTRPSTCTRRSRPTSTTWCTPRARPRCWPSARRSSPSGGCAAGPWPRAWTRPGSACSPSCATRPSSGARCGRRTPSSACTRSSSGASRRSASCPAPRPPRCCSGHCSRPARSPCARSTAGRASPRPRASLTSPPDRTNHAGERPRRRIPPNSATGPSAARHRHAASAGRPVLPGAHRLPVAPPAAAPGLPALADDPRLHARLRERGRLGGDPPPPRGDAARTRRPGARPHRRDRRHPERQDDGKGGPRGCDAAKKVKGRKRHVAVDTGGLLLGVTVHAADVQDADGVGDLLRRLKRLYPWLKAVFADGAYDRLAALLACFLLGLTLIIVRRLAGTEGFVLLPRHWVAERTLGWLGRWRRLARDYEELPEVSETMVKLAVIRLILHRLAHPNRKRLPPP